MAKFATAEEIIKLAESQVGVKEYPMNSNKVKYNTAYYKREVSGSAYPWCCAFIWWLFNELESNDLFYGGKQTAYCPTLRSYHKKQKVTKDYKPGDIIFFNFSGGSVAKHVGLCVDYNATKGTITTIDGNTGTNNEANGGCVMYRTRSIKYVLDGYRPDYTSSKEEKNNNETVRKVYQINVPLLQEGDEGADVKSLQILLTGHGYKAKDDGKFGPATKKQLLAYQKKKKLTQDGMCGPQVWRSFIGG